jgi:septum formation protein
MRKWILASASPRREMILGRLGLRFTVDPSGITEPNPNPNEKMHDYAIRVARLKAEEVAGKHRSGIILAADTIVVLGNKVLGKPSDGTDAALMLKRLSGRWHEVISGICLLDCVQHRARTDASRTRVHFRRISAGEIAWYLKSGEYRDKAGAYGAQGLASLFIDRIDGCFFNVVGFPVAAFESLCRKSGIDLTKQLSDLADQCSILDDRSASSRRKSKM